MLAHPPPELLRSADGAQIPHTSASPLLLPRSSEIPVNISSLPSSERELMSPPSSPQLSDDRDPPSNPVSPVYRSQVPGRIRLAGDQRDEVENSSVNYVVHEISSESEDSSPEVIENDNDTLITVENEQNTIEHPAITIESASSEQQSMLDASAIDFQDGPATAVVNNLVESKNEKVKKKSKGKKRKASESIDADNDEGSCCTICFESWSNSGEHRISSLRCGHFFGYTCIERWLRGTGASCPNCNEKSTKKDIRVHYVSKLAAIDTSERDRALGDLEKVKGELRELQLRHTELQVRLKLQQEKIDKLEGENRRYKEKSGELAPLSQFINNAGASTNSSALQGRLVYQKKHEICRPSNDRDKCCRVLACSEYHGMIVISQPSANPLFPGFGVRRFNMLDQKLGSFVALGKDVIRDLAFHPNTPELLLSCGQDKVTKITNISSCSEVVRFNCDSEIWAVDWAVGGSGTLLYLGTKRSQILIHDTRSPQEEPILLTFPGTERRPIISLVSVPACSASGLHHPGFLVLTLGSLWYWEHNMADNTFTPYKLPTPQGTLFWSLEYDPSSRLILVVCKPSPLSKHLVMELTTTTLPTGRVVTSNVIMTSQGGSYSVRSFLRSCLFVTNEEEGTVMLVYSRGTGMGDHKIILQEVGSGKIIQEISVGKPVLDIKQASINQVNYLAVLGETELLMYKWE